jgi:hypothetical protein
MKRIKDPKAKHRSAWFITISTNSTNLKLASPLKKVWEYITKNIGQFAFSRTNGNILKVKVFSTIEVGDVYHRVHLHAYIEILSEGQAFLKYHDIPIFINSQLRRIPGFVAVKFDARVVMNFNAKEATKEYMNKAPLQYEDEPFEIIV